MNSAPRKLFYLSRITASLWVALIIFISCVLFVPRFATLTNLENVGRLAAILCIASCGQSIVLILKGIDFSFGSAVALGSVVGVIVLPSYGLALAFVCVALVILAIGAANGTLIAAFGVPPVIATLGALMTIQGLANFIAGGLPFDAPESESFAWLARGRILDIPVPIFVAFFCLVFLHLILSRSTIGRSWYLIGANSIAAAQSGLQVKRNIFLGYLAASLFCAIAGMILTSRVGSAQPNLAPDLAFQTIAACAVGGVSFAGGRGSAAHVIAGVLAIAMINNAIILLNWPTPYQLIAVAVVIVGSVLLQGLWFRHLLGAWQLFGGRN